MICTAFDTTAFCVVRKLFQGVVYKCSVYLGRVCNMQIVQHDATDENKIMPIKHLIVLTIIIIMDKKSYCCCIHIGIIFISPFYKFI